MKIVIGFSQAQEQNFIYVFKLIYGPREYLNIKHFDRHEKQLKSLIDFYTDVTFLYD